MPRPVARWISSSSCQTARSISVASLSRPKLVAFDRNELDFLLSCSALIEPRPSAAGGRDMPRVLIIERTRSQRKGKKAFRQSVEFVPRRSLEKRLAKLQESGRWRNHRKSVPAIKKEKAIDALFIQVNPQDFRCILVRDALSETAEFFQSCSEESYPEHRRRTESPSA